MTRSRLLVATAAMLAALFSLSGAAVAKGEADPMASVDPMASMEPMESMGPMASMEPGLVVRDAWTRESMMGELAGAAFMVIHNSTDVDDALISASSPAAAVVELHQTTEDAEGVMAMAPVESVPIPAGGDAVLEPGGYHFMLIGLVEPLVEGSAIEINLEFAGAGEQTISVPVQAMGPLGEMGADDEQAMGHGMDPDEEDEEGQEGTEG